MPKKTLKLLIPHPTRIRQVRSLRVLGEWIYATNLWHLNRYSASMAFFVGLFIAFIPVPGQMLIAASLAVLLRCNLPLSVALVWITNPVTMPAIFFMAYKIGAMLIDVPIKQVQFELSVHWISNTLTLIWEPLLVGCAVCGLLIGSLGYFSISMLWRWRVAYRWHLRKRQRQTALAKRQSGETSSGPG